ncbi:MAG: hypothetical protein FWE62_05425 [Firmicutes bacterium]|nr:hypothetical protein [Bacillota bacterium]
MKDILLKVCGLLELEDCAAHITGGTSSDEAARLINCLNACYREIAADYCPLIAKASVVSNGLVPYAALGGRAYAVRSVKKNGADAAFRNLAAGIETESGALEIEFSYMPEELDAQSADWAYGTTVNISALCYGTASEFCLSSGMYDEAAVWHSKFIAALPDGKSLGKYLPRRRWLE